MDAGTSALTNKARLRQQILDGEQDIDTLSQSLNQQQQYQNQQQKNARYQPAYLQQQQQQYFMNGGSQANLFTSASTTNYDLMTPLPTGTPYTTNSNPSFTNVAQNSSRKSSMTSQSAAARFFRKHKGADPNFNEDSGADIGDLTNGANMSFDDITHIRNQGPYGINAASSLDTAPIIPTLGPGGTMGALGSASGSKVNNVQYRRQMNQQKKLAMINGARANSLAGGNPMMMQQQQQQQPMGGDPRTMSLMNSQGPRTMSLNSQGPRAMSMRSGPFPQQHMPYNQQFPQQYPQQNLQPMGAGGPRAMSLRTGPYPQNQMPMQMQMPNMGPRTMSMMNTGMQSNGPRTMSMMNGAYAPAGGAGGAPMPPNYPRTKSLGSQGPPMGYQGPSLRSQNLVPANPNQQPRPLPPQQQQSFSQQQQQQQQYQQQPPQLILQSFAPGQQPFAPKNPMYPPASNNQYDQPQHYSQPRQVSGPQQQYAHSSNDSLQQVVEEEEEQPDDYTHSLDPKDLAHGSEEDVIYKFEEEDANAALSRKSTLKKTNSMRVRKLNLFNEDSQKQNGKKSLSRKKPPVSPAVEHFEPGSSSDSVQTEHKELPRLPQHERQDEEDLNEIPSSPTFNIMRPTGRESYVEDVPPTNDGYKSLGANARASTHDVFVTASDFTSPQKSNKSMRLTSPHKSPEKTGKYSHLAKSSFPSPNVENDIEEDEVDEQSTIHEDPNVTRSSADDSTGSATPKEPTLFNPNRSRKALESNPKLRSIVANTAFNNFRSPSAESAPRFANPANTSKFPDYERSESPGSSVYDDSGNQKPQKFDLNNSDTDDSEFRPKVDTNAVFEQSTNGETTPPTSSTSNVSHKAIEMMTPAGGDAEYKRQSYHAPHQHEDSFYENFTEPISDVPPELRSHDERSKDFTAVKVDRTEAAEEFRPKTSMSTRRSDSGDDLRNMLPSRQSSSRLSSVAGATAPPSTVSKRSSFNLNGTKNLFKRLSKSSRRGSSIDEGDISIGTMSSRNSSFTQATKPPTFNRRVSSSGTLGSLEVNTPKKPLTFTKEEMSIMNCNNDLLNELELVTTELAASIKRELALENKLKSNSTQTSSPKIEQDLAYELTEKSKTISELQEKLSKERRLRFISEEHALLGEHGQTPSPLKLNYEKTELYKQLLIKNDLVNQLEDKLSEYEKRHGTRSFSEPRHDLELMEKYNELLKENADLKSIIIPSLEKRLADKERGHDYDEARLEIQALKTQRDELRDVVNKLTSHNSNELKLAQDKIKQLESRLQDMKKISDKLSNRNINEGKKGGKLNGFTIVNPSKKLFDD
ncbi:hypothetical protein Cantr_04054 [Candida viswanathii]|uniref:Uncharacterized protein n=1 Tax=Candida viswanathii TaxID=5486 RepID=A0A367XR23_9ASCO|nr:hypothetical protein Cantr_04054 [Candida viswanathii]